MIHESTPWRVDLLKDAALVERWAKKKQSERRDYLLEKKIFVSAFAMRKLIENRKLPDRAKSKKIRITSFKTTEDLHHFNWHRIEQGFDLEHGGKVGIEVPLLLNALIHSYVFVLCVNSKFSVTGFYVASDYRRKECLYLISLSTYLALCRFIARTWPKSMNFRIDGDGRDKLVVK